MNTNNSSIDQLRRIFYLGLILTYISGIFVHEGFHIFTSIFSLLALLVSIPFIKGITFWLSLVFLIFGSLLLVMEGATFDAYFISIRRMANIFALVTLIRALGVPMELGGYSDDIRSFVNKEIKGEGLLYIMTTVIAYLIGMSIVVASVPVVFYTIERAVKSVSRKPEKFLSMAIKRGLFLALLWTPASPLMAVSLDASNASFNQVFLPAFVVSIIGLSLATIFNHPGGVKRATELIMFTFSTKSEDKPDESHPPELLKAFGSGKTKALIVILLMLIVLLVTLEQLSDFGMLDLIIVVAVIFSFIWCLIINKGQLYLKKARELFYDSLPRYSNQASLFLSAGFFAGAIGKAEDLVAGVLEGLIVGIGSLGILYLIPVVIIVTAIAGVHPLISIIILGEGFGAMDGVVSNELLGYSFLLGGSLALLISPFSAATLITADLVHRAPFKVGVVWNGLFGVYVLIVGLLILSFLAVTG
ncbi:hypothetical protein [Natranaerobius trueperi]|uniref:Citrate transporter-like domain-containing protein n=1 Tax=Natranaerobius trueperi TaxID=759412 RepID=A0A226BZU3_9FIRM|nr:hypothetical protein [Natranaerobius trueperi]OWZ83709.1 hypothetical protein CDO51_07080 [Natranaerobius trueperi]